MLHLIILHEQGSSAPVTSRVSDKISFYPYFYIKDLLGLLVILFILSYLVFFSPDLLGHPDNYIEANPLVTPPHIVPEWYFLPFYAILRSIPNKLGGVVLMFLSILIFFFFNTFSTLFSSVFDSAEEEEEEQVLISASADLDLKFNFFTQILF